jgi:hypothetical protein
VIRKQPRVFLGLIEVSGYYARLQKGLQECGVDTTFVTFQPHRYHYGGDVAMPRAARLLAELRARSGDYDGLRKVTAAVVDKALRGWLLLWAAVHHDAFVLASGTSFLFGLRDLALLRLLRKRVVLVFHGSDERPPYLDGYLPDDSAAALRARTEIRATTMKRAARFADVIVSNPNSAQMQRARCVVYQIVGNPVTETEQSGPVVHDRDDGPVRVLHAPSDPVAKGTDLVRAAVEGLVSDGAAIEYVEVMNVDNATLQREIATCDIVVDQAFGDTFAMLPAEAALFGKPAVIGTYGEEHLRRYVPSGSLPPAAYCLPDKLAATLRMLVDDSVLRRELGRAAQRYVRERWAPREVAARFLELIEGEPPRQWTFDPREVTYAAGSGGSLDRIARRAKSVLDDGGPGALHLDEKPDLLRRVLALCHLEPGGDMHSAERAHRLAQGLDDALPLGDAEFGMKRQGQE